MRSDGGIYRTEADRLLSASHTVNAILPPGFSTRYASWTAASGSGKVRHPVVAHDRIEAASGERGVIEHRFARNAAWISLPRQFDLSQRQVDTERLGSPFSGSTGNIAGAGRYIQ
jgi:hypothetical protein